jgi:hypothetical protein
VDRRRLGSLVLVAALISSCGGATTFVSGGSDSTTPSTPSPPTGTRQVSTPPVVELLDFEAPLLGGGTFRGADLAGKDVAFWFWAPW